MFNAKKQSKDRTRIECKIKRASALILYTLSQQVLRDKLLVYW